MPKVSDFLSISEEKEVIEAIRTAEKNTSGEIRVHLEAHAGDALHQRATYVFDFLHMNNTKYDNGVLFYVAVEQRALVILGDKGIDRAVPENFWDSTKALVLSHFSNGKIKDGLVAGILIAGEQLKAHFPYQSGDVNELPNEIST